MPGGNLPMSDVTQLLGAINKGDSKAAEELLPLIYEELRKLAAHKMAQEQPGHTLQPTALVHEAWLRLVGSGPDHWNSRGHFFAAAAEAMRRILVESARRKRRIKRGGDRKRIDFDAVEISAPELPNDILALDDALTQFAAADPEAAQLVELHYFAGLTLEQ